jgi:hypothetical protein
VSFAAITLCVASQREFVIVVYFVMNQSGNFWIYSRVFINRQYNENKKKNEILDWSLA